MGLEDIVARGTVLIITGDSGELFLVDPNVTVTVFGANVLFNEPLMPVWAYTSIKFVSHIEAPPATTRFV